MRSIDQLHAVEEEIIKNTPRFRRLITTSRFSRASALVSSFAIGLAGLAHAEEMKLPGVKAEYDTLLEKIDQLWHAVEVSAENMAISSYADLLNALQNSHTIVRALVSNGDDPGTRGDDTIALGETVTRALATLSGAS